MAPLKRSRRDEEHEEVIAVESASSALRQDAQRKKARISGASKAQDSRDGSPTTSSSSEEEEDEDAPTDVNETPALPQTQYEQIRDGGWEHLRHAEDDDHRATQRFLARSQLIGENHAANNAIIEEITCVNFMCHARLHVKLGPLLNFVVGMNGSGKSAVLTAITLCLGGRTASTNRGASLKSLIKGGEDQAVLIVKLKNQGLDAYQPDVFGKSIIVERHFSRGGSSGFKLKTETGRLISTKKGDVEDVVEYYQLQVDNPMNVLTQDAAKSFITRSTPKQKYKFFIEGVQLEALDRDYKLVSETCDTIEAKLAVSKEDIQSLKKKADEAQRRADTVERHSGMRNEAKKLTRQSAWAQVEVVERKLADREASLVTAQLEIDKQEATMSDKGFAFQRVEDHWEQTKEDERRAEDEFAPLKAGEEYATNAHAAARKDVENAHGEVRRIHQGILEAQAKVESYRGDIEGEMQRIEDANGGSHARKLAEIQKAQETVDDTKMRRDENEAERPSLEETLAQLQDAVKRSDRPPEVKRKEIDAANQRLQQLNQSRGNVWAGFHDKMPQLVKMIRQDSGFREAPVGPIGRHVKLLKPIWSSILERTMGNMLNAFVVTSKFDQMRLEQMMRRVGLQWSPILIANRHAIDTTGHEPDSQLDTILRVLEIDDDLVRNQLIITQGIEQSVLIENRKEAEQVMYDGPRPRNVKQCFIINAFERNKGHRLGFGGRSGNTQDISPIDPFLRKPRMQTDVESQISLQRDTVNQLERQLSTLEQQRRQSQEALKVHNQHIVKNKRAGEKLRIDVQRAESRVEELQSEFDQANIEDGRLEGLKTYLADAEQELDILKETYGNAGLERQRFNTISSEKKTELEDAKALAVDHEIKIKKAQKKIKRIEQARNIALQEKNLAISVLEDLKGNMAVMTDKRDKSAALVEDWTGQANQVCPRVPVDVGETAQTLDAKLTKLRDQLTVYQKRQGATDEQIYNVAAETKRVYETAVSYQDELSELHSLLKQSFMKRIEMYRKFQRYIACSSRVNFNYLLSERAFRGKLTIDHIAKKLDVHVEPDETTRSAKGRQTKTLSGGEKSFSNICLLLSLWEAMGAPLRCLDEFDVFMDDVNRDVSTKMIISGARRSVGRQFILITPKALGAAAANAQDVKIIKLYDPREKRVDDMMNEG